MTATTKQFSVHGLISASPILPLLLLFGLPATTQAEDYAYTTNNGTITITKYTGPGGAVTIPGIIKGLPVTRIGVWAFFPSPRSKGLTSVTIPDSVTRIGDSVFSHCHRLASVTIGKGVTHIGQKTFLGCRNLKAVYFNGNAPDVGNDLFQYADKATVYYLPGTTGWERKLEGRPTKAWKP